MSHKKREPVRLNFLRSVDIFSGRLYLNDILKIQSRFIITSLIRMEVCFIYDEKQAVFLEKLSYSER